MLDTTTITYTAKAAALAAGLTLNAPQAGALTVEDMRESMSVEAQVAYVSGVVEGLAFGRWIENNRDQAGMNCILGWYYQQPNDDVWLSILDFFDQHPDQHIGTLMYALIREECGE